MRGRRPRRGTRLALRDLLDEALAGTAQRPGRTVLTALGTILGVGTFVAVVGLTATAGGQISQRFDELTATEVRVAVAEGGGDGGTGSVFPDDADARARVIDGVVDAGVAWTVDDQGKRHVTGAPLPGADRGAATPITAASPGYLRAVKPTLREGRLYDDYHDAQRQPVVVLGAAAARNLGVTTLAANPAVFIDGVPFTVVGIVDDVARDPHLLFGALVPRRTAERQWGPPPDAHAAAMLVDTRLGAARVTADQIAVALRPDAPRAFSVTPPPDPTALRDRVSADVSGLFVLLAAVCLVIGAVGIANTTLVAVLERVPEIGLRRALGARRRHIAAQFLVESGAVGTAGGLAGTSIGVVVVVAVALARHWTAVLPPSAVGVAPLIGTAVGVLAGLYPAIRAARIEPVDALRR